MKTVSIRVSNEKVHIWGAAVIAWQSVISVTTTVNFVIIEIGGEDSGVVQIPHDHIEMLVVDTSEEGGGSGGDGGGFDGEVDPPPLRAEDEDGFDTTL